MTTVQILIRLLLKEQSDLGLHSFVRPTSPNTKIFTVYNILSIMLKILRKKYFDKVSQG